MRKILGLFLSLLLLSSPAQAQIISAFTQGGSGSCAYNPPLDSFSGSAAYSFRLLRTAYSGGNVVTIQRSSDSTQKTFTASTPNCTINTADAFFDGSTYTVVTWYDQSGNGANATQATQANRPTVNLNCQNGHPCAVFNGTSNQMSATLASSMTAGTIAAVADITSQSATHQIVTLGTSSTGILLGYSSLTSKCNANRLISSTSHQGTLTCANSTWFRWIGTYNSTLSSVYLNGTKGTDDTTTQTIPSATALIIGALAVNSNFMVGNTAEIIVFAPDLSITNSNTVSSNQGSYWGL